MSDAEVTVETGYGPITVTTKLLTLWNRYGWPTEPCLRDMAKVEKILNAGQEPTP